MIERDCKTLGLEVGRGMCFGGLNEPPWHTALPPNRPESGLKAATRDHNRA